MYVNTFCGNDKKKKLKKRVLQQMPLAPSTVPRKCVLAMLCTRITSLSLRTAKMAQAAVSSRTILSTGQARKCLVICLFVFANTNIRLLEELNMPNTL